MKKILNTLFEQKRLTKNESKEVLINIAQEKYNTSQIAAFITVFLMRPVSVDELSGFREALLELAVKVNLSDFNTIDLCGTGGDGKNTFNISTLTSFIVAGTGNKVAKHGNYGVSSASGSSNMLEFLGYKFTNDESLLKKQLDKANICFLHAPLFHPAMKVVAPIRRELGVKTFFNMLGPLVNPSTPQNQLVGVFNLEVARVYNYILQECNINYGVVHALDGYDEISLTGDFKLFTKDAEQQISPADLGQKQILQSDIFGGDTVAEAAEIFMNIINGKGTNEQNNVVLTNTAFALKTFDKNKTFESAFEEAKDSLFGLKAKEALQKLIG
ncbi:anthranilate phosphoribosyltransferase [Tenacibaculum maritimum]|uniref:Anthranilate phosphoribosyltransferase n=1 Tax=Tenacibaculum maritimum NCIMB 2154 TaxID=1349785 RepID=A0A2H1ED53_9FLAO|nr:anthranilate phosphoribosyltransferase [Tenacibaculum maritimum]MCD9581886.1 anthranilate phosphoribosyltransferase [Tenacibaculum maritimum]MCD9621052.1 anthranilate phosphoribosyltransferase [Tenacibaculum maritimum]MCD9627040.1 anthranilate phosphoribosyltransferase [Tenacibaculum maritimum]MCD9630368.1 anthranilate phosphoribosyltransferase [Tenacibaculum maritimum]MCD9633782.1 anthranilate phosphoribosyltransferase [Tenacibaculum maritimum]